MKDLSQITFKTRYRSSEHNLLKDLYIPALSCAESYHRSVGYFTSRSIAEAAQGLAALIEAGGRLKLIASPVLTDEDIQACNNGYKNRDELVRGIAQEAFAPTESKLANKRLEALAWLIAEKRLDIKLAFKINSNGKFVRGIYHEKLGVIQDPIGHYIAFDGSANETEGGLVTNFERIPVHCSWNDPQRRAQDIVNDFDKLWENTTSGLRVMEFTEVAAELLAPYKPTNKPQPQEEISEEELDISPPLPPRPPEDGNLHLPKDLDLRDYQKEIIQDWVRHNGKGIVEHATGTGKTITALAAATHVRKGKQLNALLVICPYQNLVTQWAKEIENFGVTPIKAYRARDSWHGKLSDQLIRPNWSEDDPILCVVATFATFSGDAFQNLLSMFPRKSMFIADEVHHLGSETLHSRLPISKFPMRMALSATPRRWQDREGTERIYEWFGPETLKPVITVGNAIERGALCPYMYYPRFIHLQEAEKRHYKQINRTISQLLDDGHKFGTSRQLKDAINARSTILALAGDRGKELCNIIESMDNVRRTLVYCGSGKAITTYTDDKEEEEDDKDKYKRIRQVQNIINLISSPPYSLRASRYLAETTPQVRDENLQYLENGDLNAIVAINCLDEGVDIPCVETAIIMSSSENPRQFIQRRGRVLRNFEGKKYANIYDMIVIPTEDEDPTDTERNLMAKEINRYLDFSKDALNRHDAEALLLPIQDKFDLY